MNETWDAHCDVVIVGFGGAGAAAAIEAADAGASVIALDRFGGGGATALSGGVVYAGGGTEYQQRAGFDDSPENMLAYLRREVGDVVSEGTLRNFCDDSVSTLAWLEDQGVPFEASLCPFKTSYPTDDYYLYFSGNEQAAPYRDIATPAPRGHRTKGRGTSGRVLFGHLRSSAIGRGIDLRTAARATRLITEGDTVVGVEYTTLAPDRNLRRRLFNGLTKMSGKTSLYAPPIAKLANLVLDRIERTATTTIRVRARGGVILSAGGFTFNREMLATYAPDYTEGLPLGTVGDDGAGIVMGRDVGGATGHLDAVSAWRFYCPPQSMMSGILVDRRGERVCNEDLYGAAVGRHMVEDHGGEAWLIVDQALFDQVKSDVKDQTALFQKVQLKFLLSRGYTRGDTPAALAAATGIDPSAMSATVERYNRDAADGADRAWDKAAKLLRPLTTGPYYAFDCSLKGSLYFPCPVMTLGGLQVDEASGLVTRDDGTAISGLYAAGRNAVGIASNNYVSGLSIADCIHSGRRAGRHAATAV